MKLSTNYKIEAKVCHISYYSGDDSLTIHTEDDEMVEVYGVDLSTMLCLTRNFLVVDAKLNTFCKHQVDQLREIKDAVEKLIRLNTKEEDN